MRYLSLSLVMLLLLFAPWAFGCSETWSVLILKLGVGASLLLTILRISTASAHEISRPIWSWQWGVPLAALGVFLLLQAWNPSHEFQVAGSPLHPRPFIEWLPSSVHASATWETIGLWSAYAALFWLARTLFPATSRWKLLSVTLVVSGFSLALFAIAQYLSGTHKIFWVRPIHDHLGQNWNGFFGTFVNPNNYAAYVNLLIPLALSLGRQAQRMQEMPEVKSHPGYLFYFMAAVMIVSVFLSRSRAGIVICVALVVGWISWQYLHNAKKGRQGEKTLLIGVLALVLIGAISLWYLGFEPVRKELATLRNLPDEMKGSRTVSYIATLDMFYDRWLYGTGAGTFSYAFPFYKPASLGENYYRYLHNDWLQTLAELGTLGTALLAAFVGGVIWSWHRLKPLTKKNHPDHASASMRRRLRGAYILSVFGVLLHAIIDFPLQIPSIATLAVVFFALATTHEKENPI